MSVTRIARNFMRWHIAYGYLAWVLRYSKDNFPNILKLVEGLQKIGAKHGASAGQVALAWLLAQGDDIIPIPGTTKLPVRPFPLDKGCIEDMCAQES